MSKKLRRALIWLLAAALAGVVGYLGCKDRERAAAARIYAEAERLAGVPDLGEPAPTPTPTPAPTRQPTPSPSPGASAPVSQAPEPSEPEPEPSRTVIRFQSLEDIDLEVLRKYNPDVVGWIAIPGVLSYPLMQGRDNSFYLSHAWNGVRNSVGSVFVDYRCSPGMDDFNTVIYAHRTYGRAMFGGLAQYSSQSFWEAHPDVYLVTDAGIARYRIYAAYEAALTAPTYQNQFSSDASKENFIRFGLEQSAIDAGDAPDTQSGVITLSTCTGRGHSTRWVVQAARME